MGHLKLSPVIQHTAPIAKTCASVLATACLVLGFSASSASLGPTKPNVIVIFADDLGYHDLGVQGATDLKTPHINSLATNGVRFTSGYATCPICSPSRAGLITGRYQQRFGHETNPGLDLELDPRFGLPLTESTIANRLKPLGYATGWIGKSHLGARPPYHPLNRGFDEFFGFLEGHHEYTRPGIPVTQRDPILRGTNAVPETNYLTYAFAREITNFIARHAAEPFFIYAPFNAVHTPHSAPPELFARFATNNFTDPKRYVLAAVLAGLDDAVGAILGQLRALDLETNTLIFFTSDNGGPTPFNGSLNTPLRGYKTEAYEGGIRVPFLAQWRGVLPAGAVVNTPISTLDILPTAIAAAGGTVPAAWQLDGVNLLPLLKGQTTSLPRANLFWRLETDGRQTQGEDSSDGIRAVRSGDWKLIKPALNATWELYDLANDLSETTNLADARPDKVKELLAAYDAWAAQLARPLWAYGVMPYATPEFVPEDIRVGSASVSYLAPSFRPDGSHVAFQDAANRLWRGEIDPRTGTLVSATGQDLLVDTGATPVGADGSGPDWGLSTNGAAIFYTKPASTGLRQIWRARIAGNSVTTAQLTSSMTDESFGVRASRVPGDASVRLLFNVGNSAQFTASWADENSPTSVFALPRAVPDTRNGSWLPLAPDLVYRSPNQNTSQITRYFAVARTAGAVTADRGDKSDVCGFLAPEFGGELCYAAVVNRAAVAIYRDLRDRPDGLPTLVATLVLPTNATQRFLSSLEPLAGGRGFNGVSYFTCVASQNSTPQNPGDSAVWLLGLGPDLSHPIARRLDEGAFSGVVADRRSPKTFIGERKVFCYYTRFDGTNPAQLRLAKTGLLRPDHAGPPSGFANLGFTRSFNAGATDTNGLFMGGTETMNLVAHRGRLFAAKGSRQQLPYPTNQASAPANWTGAQILVKDSPSAPWRVDDNVPPIFRGHLRVETMAEITLTTRANGTVLNPAETLLLAGLSDIGATGANVATSRTRRDTAPFGWEESHIATAAAGETAHALSFGAHVEHDTGAHLAFAGLANGRIYRGAYNGASASRIAWASNAVELAGVGPVTAFAEANGLLYAACGLRQNASNAPITGGLYERRDTNNDWRLVYQWLAPVRTFAAPEEQRVALGLTAVPEPRGDGRDVLLVARAWPGVIERVDPSNNFTATIELDVRDFFARRWQDERVRSANVTIGYTGFTPVNDPVTGERVHLVGLWIQHPDINAPSFNSTHFLIRHRDGTYEPADLANLTPPLASCESLRTTRCIAVSPFAAQGETALYFGGYDTGATPSTNTAWIARGDWLAWPRLTISQPDPPAFQLTWPVAETNWLLETSAAVGPRANWQPVPGLSTRSLTHQTQSVGPQASNAFFRVKGP